MESEILTKEQKNKLNVYSKYIEKLDFILYSLHWYNLGKRWNQAKQVASNLYHNTHNNSALNVMHDFEDPSSHENFAVWNNHRVLHILNSNNISTTFKASKYDLFSPISLERDVIIDSIWSK